MIDFHNHVLPNVDDGPKTMDVTLDMLECAKQQGINIIVNTVHYKHPKMKGKNTNYDFINKIKDEVVNEFLSRGKKIKIYITSEVYFSSNLCSILNDPIATFNDFMLIEFHPTIKPPNYINTFFDLRMKGIKPILAHPERYRFVQNNPHELESLKKIDVLFQIDAGSILGQFGLKTKKTAFKLLQNGFCDLIGSDSHNNRNRNFCIKRAYDLLSKSSAKIPKALNHNSSCIIDNSDDFINVDFKKQNFLNKLLKKIVNN